MVYTSVLVVGSGIFVAAKLAAVHMIAAIVPSAVAVAIVGRTFGTIPFAAAAVLAGGVVFGRTEEGDEQRSKAAGILGFPSAPSSGNNWQ